MELLYDNTTLSIILLKRDRFALLTLQTDNNINVLIRHIEIFSNVFSMGPMIILLTKLTSV